MTTKPESDDTKIALINNNIEFIKKDIVEIKLALQNKYATNLSLETVAKETELRLKRLESSSNLWKWLSPILAAILGSVLTFLIIQYLMGLR